MDKPWCIYCGKTLGEKDDSLHQICKECDDWFEENLKELEKANTDERDPK